MKKFFNQPENYKQSPLNPPLLCHSQKLYQNHHLNQHRSYHGRSAVAYPSPSLSSPSSLSSVVASSFHRPCATTPFPCTTLFLRTYARRTTRTRLEEVEAQEQQQQQQQQQGETNLQQQRKEQQPMGSWASGDDEQQSTEQSLTEDIRKHLAKVYGTLMAGLGLATVGSLTAMLLPPALMGTACVLGAIGSLVGIISLIFISPEKIVLRQNLFLGITGLVGLSIAPLLAASAPGVILAATLGTSAIFGGFTLAALKAKRKSMLMLGGVLGGGLLLVFSCGLAAFILPLLGVTNPAILGALYNINLYLGLGIFSLFIAYDTQNMIEMYRNGNDDHVGPALNLFLNIINIFIRLLRIFGGRD